MPAFAIAVKVPGHEPLAETKEFRSIILAMEYATHEANVRGGSYLNCSVRHASDPEAQHDH